MNGEQLELVTAYVDGEATADERAIVEADAELMAEVDRQRSLRDLLDDVPPPSDESRETAVAAALAVFDRLHLPATMPTQPDRPSDVTAPTNIVPLEQRRRLRWMQGLGAAAAAAVVVVVGAAIVTRDGGDDGTTADQQPAAATALERERDTAPDEALTAIVTTTVGPEIMAAVPETSVFEAAGAEDDTAGTSESNAAGDAAEAPPAPAAAPPTTAAAGVAVISTEADLAALANDIKEQLPTLADAEDACVDQLLKADATLEAGDGTQHPILVVVVDDDTIGALSLDDCEVVLEADR